MNNCTNNTNLVQLQNFSQLNGPYVTVIGTTHPANKQCGRNADGSIYKKAGPAISEAYAWTCYVPDQNTMAQLLQTIGNEENLVLSYGYVPGTGPGIPADFQPGRLIYGNQYWILSRKKIAQALGIEDENSDQILGWHTINGERVIARLKKNFKAGRWMLLDKDDVEGLPEHLRTPPGDYEAWWNQMQQICPAFIGAEVMFYHSASSRVYDKGQPISPNAGFHALVQIEDPDDMERFGTQLLAHAMLKGFGFRRPIYGRTSGVQTGKRVWANFDPTTFSCERISYDGKPMASDGLTVLPPNIQGYSGNIIDTSELKSVTAQENSVLHKKYGITVAVEGGNRAKRQSFIMQDDKNLRLDTVIETQNGLITIKDFWLSQKGHVRIQAPFRDSDSWNGYVNMFSDGTPFCFDNGSRIRHDLVEEERIGPDPEEFIDYMVENISDVDKWPEYLPKISAAVVRHKRDPTYDSIIAARIKEKSNRRISVGDVKESIKQARKRLRRSYGSDSTPVLDVPYSIVEDVLRSKYEKDGIKLLMSTEDGSFWHYGGTHWERVSDTILRGQLLEHIKENHGRILAQYININGDNSRAPEINRILSSAFDLLVPMTARGGDPLHQRDEPQPALNGSNGTVHLTDNGPVLKPHSPDDGLTYCSPITYDPQAGAPTYQYLMEQTLRVMGKDESGREVVDWTETRERVRHVEELLGYAIQPWRGIKAWAMFHGAGDNGKGKVIDLVIRIIGQHAIMGERIDKIDGDVFKTGDLFGKLLLIDDDVAANARLPDGFLKKISERKLLTGQYKHKDPFNYFTTVFPVLLTNSYPRCSDLTRGMRTRAQIINFERIFKRPDECSPHDPDRQRPDLWDHVYAKEMSGVLNRLIAGYYRVRSRGSFAPPRSCQAAREEWIGEANTLSRFLGERCENVPGARIGLTDLFINYQMWAHKEKIPENRRATRHSMGTHLRDLGYSIRHTNWENSVAEGLRLKPVTETGELLVIETGVMPTAPAIPGLH